MAMSARGRGDEDEVQGGAAQPQQPPSFILLPDIAHATIASFLPDGDNKKDNRLRVSEVSHVLHDAYGGSLISASLYTPKVAAPLVALLGRQKKLSTLVVNEQRAYSAVFQATHQGCCRRVQRLELDCGAERETTVKRINDLVEALQVEGALPALQRFKLSAVYTPDVLSKVAHVLKRGAVPNLEHFNVWQCDIMHSEIDLLSDMVEARAEIPGCKPFVKGVIIGLIMPPQLRGLDSYGLCCRH